MMLMMALMWHCSRAQTAWHSFGCISLVAQQLQRHDIFSVRQNKELREQQFHYISSIPKLQPPGVCPGDREKARNLPDNWQMSALSHFQKQMSDKAATKTFYAPLCPAIHNLYVANKSAPRDRLRIACQMG